MDRLGLIRSGKWAHGIDDAIGALLLATEELCFELNALSPSKTDERTTLIHRILGEVGECCVLHSPFHCDFGFNIKIGHHFVGNYNLTILDEADVIIGNNVFVGPNVGMYTIAHALTAGQRNDGIMTARTIVIGNDVWIGAGVTILPGVTVGDGAVIGAGSVVTKCIPPSVLAVGNPCRVVRSISGADDVEVAD